MPKRSEVAQQLGRSAVVALLAFAVLLFSEQRALAAGADFTPEGYVLAGSAAAAAAVPFLVADVAYTLERRWLPPGWAIPQIVIGGGVNAAVTVWGISSRFSKSELPVWIGTTVLSVGFIAHGVASLVWYEPPPATKASGRIGRKSHSAYLRWLPDIVVTRDRSTFVTFRGVF